MSDNSDLIEGEGYLGDKILAAALLPRSCLQSGDLNKVILAVEPSMRAPMIRQCKWRVSKQVLFYSARLRAMNCMYCTFR